VEKGNPLILAPPMSKSDAQRALVLADILGVKRESFIRMNESTPRDVVVLARGLDSLKQGGEVEIDVEDGGLPFRVLVTQAALNPNSVTRFVGSPRLGERPIDDLLDSLTNGIPGLKIEKGTPWPLTISTPSNVNVNNFHIKGIESSQFASSLLLGAARLVSRGSDAILVKPEGMQASEGYLQMTRAWMERVGFELDGHSVESAPKNIIPFSIPGDWSSLTYLLLFTWNTEHWVDDVDVAAQHPDKKFVEYLSEVGIELETRAALVSTGFNRKTQGHLIGFGSKGLKVDVRECPDATPTLAALACVLTKPSIFKFVNILKAKESDRLDGIFRMVQAVGCQIEMTGDASFRINPAWNSSGLKRSFEFDSQNDHRLAMSAAVLSHLSRSRLTLKGRDCVKKSFPHFWREASKAGLTVF
jgi:3-phosphoshikimate 1-carboxyvinyltransferase